MVATGEYHPRLLDPIIADTFGEFPAIMLIGPRAVGKTTTARRHAKTVISLDKESEAFAFRADPDASLAQFEEPILLDEWQEVPEILGAIKRSIDDQGFQPGRFLLTGSARSNDDPKLWPGTGRIIRMTLHGMTMRERLANNVTDDTFLDRLAMADPDILKPPSNPPDLRGYIDAILQSGFPEVSMRLTESGRLQWLTSYMEQVFTRDIPKLEAVRATQKLRRFFTALALNTAGIADNKTLYDAAGISADTATVFLELFQSLSLIDSLPAWASNRLKRLTRSPKRFLTDAALAAGILNLDARTVLLDGDLLGRLLDTFVVSQIRAELPAAKCRPRLYHLRLPQGRHEVDLIAELPDRQVIGIEIKATSAPKTADIQHLAWLRDQLGDRFKIGAILHTGPRVYKIQDRILAVPISSIWSN